MLRNEQPGPAARPIEAAQRFYVEEHSGYPGMSSGGSARPTTEVMVIDRYYSHQVMASFGSTYRQQDVRGKWITTSLENRRALAREECDRLNAGRPKPKNVEDEYKPRLRRHCSRCHRRLMTTLVGELRLCNDCLVADSLTRE